MSFDISNNIFLIFQVFVAPLHPTPPISHAVNASKLPIMTGSF